MPTDTDRRSIHATDMTDISGKISNAAVSIPPDARCLDTIQLTRLEQSFREWAGASPRRDVQDSRKRILMIFLLIRYTGARLNEVLHLNPLENMDFNNHIVFFRKIPSSDDLSAREVRIPENISSEIKIMMEKHFTARKSALAVDAAHIRRKFYERSAACGFPKEYGAPDAIRKSRAIELMQHNMPLPLVQRILGHSTPNLAASYVEFSEEDMRRLAIHFTEKESHRKTSARNMFFGKIRNIRQGDIQSIVEILTIGEFIITTVITNDSRERLGLKPGVLITAEVKAPWVILHRGDTEPLCTAENRLRGSVERIRRGETTTEYVVRIFDGASLCAVTSRDDDHRLDINENDVVWAIFNSFAIVLHVE